MMSWLAPLDIGLQIGLILAWPVVGFSMAFRLMTFPDLTVEASVPLGAAVFATFLRAGAPLTLAFVAAVAAGWLAGATTAFLHVRFHVNKFLAGIIVVAIAYSLSLRTMNGPNIGLLQLPSIFDRLRSLDGRLGPTIHVGTILFLAVNLCVMLVLLAMALSSRPGLRLMAAGSNPEYARSLGISVPLALVLGVAAANGLAAWGGALIASYQGFADIGLGQGVLILALASLTLGERILPTKRLSLQVFVLGAAVLGSVVYQLLVSYAIRLGLATTDLRLVTAVLVLLVVARRVSRGSDIFSEALK